jgi:hypothetical protein
MGDDWIKKRKKLIDDPRTVALANRLNATGQHILGCLDLLWSLADSFADPETGFLKGYSADLVDQKVRHPGFANACASVTRNHPDGSWLVIQKKGVIFPDYGKHNGSTAKTRALTAKRVAKHRAGKDEGHSKQDVTHDVTQPELPEETKTRPEEIREKQPPPTTGDYRALIAYAREVVCLPDGWLAVVRDLLLDFGVLVLAEGLEHLASRRPSARVKMAHEIQSPVAFLRDLLSKVEAGEPPAPGPHPYETYQDWRTRREAEVAKVGGQP